ncbi:MAG: hypothetical protein AB7F86_08920 [Bdellovibrionales bacterium]
MKIVMSAFITVITSASLSASADCWLTNQGSAKYSSLNISGCPDNLQATCIVAEDLAGKKTVEILRPLDCQSGNCRAESDSFLYVIKSTPSQGEIMGILLGTYIADKSDQPLLVCSGQ